jgi:hypothetical protein
MTWAMDRPHGQRWGGHSQPVTSTGVRPRALPVGAVGVGVLAALVGAWGAISVFVGPYFGYEPTSTSTWDWTTQNWFLHLLPGAVAFVAGLMIASITPSRRAQGGSSSVGLASLLVIAAGAWFVIGPALWPTFASSAPFASGTSAGTAFLNQLGSSLGPGLLLAVLGGMALKAVIARPAVALGEGEVGEVGEPAMTQRPASMEETAAPRVDNGAPVAAEPSRTGVSPQSSD